MPEPPVKSCRGRLGPHPLTPDNVIQRVVEGRTVRTCRTCHNLHNARSARKRRQRPYVDLTHLAPDVFPRDYPPQHPPQPQPRGRQMTDPIGQPDDAAERGKRLGDVPPDKIRSQGIHGSGSSKYTPSEYWLVVNLINRHTEEPIPVEQIALQTQVSGQAIRTIVHDADGVDLILGGSGHRGYKAARDREDARRFTDRLASQQGTTQIRIDRRNAYSWPEEAAR